MIVTFVHVWLKPAFTDEFVAITIENHKSSIKEPGNLRFDILRDATDKNKFVLYEAYSSEEAAVAHKQTPHYLKWRDTVVDWMARPREGQKHIVVYPDNKELW